MSVDSLDDTAYDVVVIGSGFGGSVAALRLTEKGYRVLVLEAGRRFEDHQFAKTSWDVRKFLFAPRLGCFGIQRIRLLRDGDVFATGEVMNDVHFEECLQAAADAVGYEADPRGKGLCVLLKGMQTPSRAEIALMLICSAR